MGGPLTERLQEEFLEVGKDIPISGDEIFFYPEGSIIINNVRYNGESAIVVHVVLDECQDETLEFMGRVESGGCDGCKTLRELQKEGITHNQIRKKGPVICALNKVSGMQPHVEIISTGKRKTRHNNRTIVLNSQERSFIHTGPFPMLISVIMIDNNKIKTHRSDGVCQIIDAMSGTVYKRNPDQTYISEVLQVKQDALRGLYDNEYAVWSVVLNMLNSLQDDQAHI